MWICCILIKLQTLAPNGVHSANDEEKQKQGQAQEHHLTMHDMGLSTVIGAANKDSTGKPLSASVKSSIERLRTWDSRSSSTFFSRQKPKTGI